MITESPARWTVGGKFEKGLRVTGGGIRALNSYEWVRLAEGVAYRRRFDAVDCHGEFHFFFVGFEERWEGSRFKEWIRKGFFTEIEFDNGFFCVTIAASTNEKGTRDEQVFSLEEVAVGLAKDDERDIKYIWSFVTSGEKILFPWPSPISKTRPSSVILIVPSNTSIKKPTTRWPIAFCPSWISSHNLCSFPSYTTVPWDVNAQLLGWDPATISYSRRLHSSNDINPIFHSALRATFTSK